MFDAPKSRLFLGRVTLRLVKNIWPMEWTTEYWSSWSIRRLTGAQLLGALVNLSRDIRVKCVKRTTARSFRQDAAALAVLTFAPDSSLVTSELDR